MSAYCFSLPNSFTVTIYTSESDLALWAKYVCTYTDFDSSLVSCSHIFEHNQQLFSAKQLYKVQPLTCPTAQPQSDTDRKIPARNTEETNVLEEPKPGGKTATTGPTCARQTETRRSGNAGCVNKQLLYLKGHICNCCVDNKQISCSRAEDKLPLASCWNHPHLPTCLLKCFLGHGIVSYFPSWLRGNSFWMRTHKKGIWY